MQNLDSIKTDIKNRLIQSLKAKFENYKPESAAMPFHTRLLGKDRMALYSFIQSLNTNFGVSIFEPVAESLAKNNFKYVEKQKDAGDIITKNAQRAIQDIMDNLESGKSKPNKDSEIKKILNVAKDSSNGIAKVKPTKIDIFLERENSVYLIDIKTAKPNKGGFKEFKRTLLTWVATFAYNNMESNINTLIAIPYNPYEPKPYQRWTMAGMLDLDKELKVAKDFWDFLGGDGSYELLLESFEEVGLLMRDEIDSYFKRFNI